MERVIVYRNNVQSVEKKTTHPAIYQMDFHTE